MRLHVPHSHHLGLLLELLLSQTQQRISGFLQLCQRTLGAGVLLCCLPVQMLATLCSAEDCLIHISTFELFFQLDSNGQPPL